jgi:hypothetical protein
MRQPVIRERCRGPVGERAGDRGAGADVDVDGSDRVAVDVGLEDPDLGDPVVVGRGRDAALDRAEDGTVRVALAAGFGGGQGGLAGGEVDGQDRVQREGELDDPEQDDEEEREDQDEFDQGLAFLPAATTASAGSRVDG